MQRVYCCFYGFLILFSIQVVLYAEKGEATPLFSTQASERCDTCHVNPDPNDPKWVEENYKLSERKCRLSCNACHVNPSGGMLRNKTGFYFGTKTLPMKDEIAEPIQQGIDLIKGNEFLTFGGDFRVLTLFTDEWNKADFHIFPMQGDLYLRAGLTEHFTFMTQFGLERGGNTAVREVFGLIEKFPFNSYIKIGKLIPPYGHRLEDHTAYIRSEIAFDHSKPDAYNAGIEVGMEPLVFFWRLAYFNEDVTPSSTSGLTSNGVSGVAGWRGLWLHLGFSGLNINDFDSSTLYSTDRSAYGVFGSLRFKNLAYLFEWDFLRDEIESGGARTIEDSSVTFNELDYKVIRGLNIKLRHETFNHDVKNDDDKKRYMVGMDLFPWPFTEFNIQYRFTEEEQTNQEDNEVLFITHFWF